MPGAYVSWVGRVVRSGSALSLKFGASIAEPGPRGLEYSGSAGSAGLTQSRSRLLEAAEADALLVEYGCAAGHEYALAFGLLRSGRDDVVAVFPGGRAERLRETALPVSLHVEGAFVYSPPMSWPLRLITQNSTGHVLSEEAHPGPTSKLCGG
jgi:hypothetical protein